VSVDADGLRPETVGDLPPQCAALNQSNVTVQSLAIANRFGQLAEQELSE